MSVRRVSYRHRYFVCRNIVFAASNPYLYLALRILTVARMPNLILIYVYNSLSIRLSSIFNILFIFCRCIENVFSILIQIFSSKRLFSIYIQYLLCFVDKIVLRKVISCRILSYICRKSGLQQLSPFLSKNLMFRIKSQKSNVIIYLFYMLIMHAKFMMIRYVFMSKHIKQRHYNDVRKTRLSGFLKIFNLST